MKNLTIKTVGIVHIVLLLLLGGAIVTTEIIILENVENISATWKRFEMKRSEKSVTMNALRRELGYGGMIHNYKNVILRQEPWTIALVNEKLGGALASISRYRSLGTSEMENQALTDIENVLVQYEKSLVEANRLMLAGKSVEEIDRLVKVDDRPALDGLNLLDAEITENKKKDSPQISKSLVISMMRKSIGYGGMIHQFKDYVLRHDARLIREVNSNIADIEEAIGLYLSLGVTDAERQALGDIRATIVSYLTVLLTVERLLEKETTKEFSPGEIDRIVRIDDASALRGFDTLTREIAAQSERDAEHVRTALAFLSDIGVISVSITLGLLLFLVLLSIWMIRRQIVAPIAKMTAMMTQLAEGDLDVQIEGTDKKNEIGEMTRAVEIFKNNAIRAIKSEAKIREHEMRYRIILDNAVDAIITINSRGIIESCNFETLNLFGYESNEELVGQNVKMLMPAPYQNAHDGYLEAFMNTGEAKIIGIGREVIGLRKDGTTFPADLKVGEQKMGDGVLFTGIIRDISERKEAEQLKSEFVSTVSHELRTPLTSIRGSLGMIKSGALDDPAKIARMTDVAFKNTVRLINLVNDLLDMEKLQSGKMEFTFTNLALKTLAEKAIEINMPMAMEFGVDIKLIHSDLNGMVQGDEDRLIQVITNLLSNAIKFSPEGGTVEVVISQQEQGFRVAVADQGPGIPENFRGRIFERFSQADSSDTRKIGGTGLGLGISKSIVDSHKGEIGFETLTGKGSIFHFTLPSIERNDKENGWEEEEGSDGKPIVLHVEDDADLCELISTVVGNEFKYIYTGSLAGARKSLAKQTFDLVIMDPWLPDGNGIDFIPTVREKNGATTPMVIFSSDTFGQEVMDQVDYTLLKTRTSNEELLRVIRSLVAENSPNTPLNKSSTNS